MRKKVERYLARKLGVDDSEIAPREDGRYEGVAGDIDNLLKAVRDPDNGSRSGSQSKRAKLRQHSAGRMPYYPPYQSLNTYANYLSTGENAVLPSASWSSWHSDMHSPYVGQPRTPPGTAKRQGNGACLSSTKKSIFDESAAFPGLLNENLDEKLGTSPSLKGLSDMSPSLSTLKDSFTTPFPSDVNMQLSPEEADSLNKALFSEGMMTPFPKTPSASSSKPREVVRFRIGPKDEGSEDKKIGKMLGGRVPISPISPKQRSPTGIYDTLSDDLQKSLPEVGGSNSGKDSATSEKDELPAGAKFPEEDVAHGVFDKTPKRDTNISIPPASVGVEKLLKDLETPATNATEPMGSSFWADDGEMTPVPLHLTPQDHSVKFKVDSTEKRKLHEDPALHIDTPEAKRQKDDNHLDAGCFDC